LADIIDAVKKAIINTIESMKLADVMYGIVDNTAPLIINIDQKLSLKQSQIIVPKHLTEYQIVVNINGIDQSCIIKNALKKNDNVALIRAQGGQKFVVLGVLE